MSILVVSNCQAFGLANCIQNLTGEPAQAVPLTTFNGATDEELDRFDAEHDHVFASPQAEERLREHPLATKVTVVPPVYFEGYHPDLIYLSRDGEKFKGPLGDYHSAIAFAAFRHGLDVDDAVRLFAAPIYQSAGYFDAWLPARLRLLSTFASAGLAIEDRFYAWCRSRPFMHTVNHPRISVLFDVAAAALRKNGLPVEAPVEIPDNLLKDTLFPVYPEIGAELGIAGSYRFRQPATSRTIGLREFVSASFAAYADAGLALEPRQTYAGVVGRVELALDAHGGG